MKSLLPLVDKFAVGCFKTFDNVVNVSVQGSGNIATRIINPVISNAILREIIGPDLFAPVSATNKLAAGIGKLFLVFFNLSLQ